MTFNEIRKKAIEMQASLADAVEARIKFLYAEIRYWSDHADGKGLASWYAKEAIDEIITLKGEFFDYLNRRNMKERVEITAADIEYARNYPIETLILFNKNGVTFAPCHDDHNPSLHHDKMHNRAHCFVCDKSWNPIDWMMEFEGLDFRQAVSFLNKR